jgi:hypothetical protein
VGFGTEIRFMGSPMLVPVFCGAAEGSLQACVVDFVIFRFAIVATSPDHIKPFNSHETFYHSRATHTNTSCLTYTTRI